MAIDYARENEKLQNTEALQELVLRQNSAIQNK
jgi:hypothetical protein